MLNKAKEKILSYSDVKKLSDKLSKTDSGNEFLNKLIPEPENVKSKDIFSEIGYLSLYGAIPVACVSDSKLVSKIQDVFTSSFDELAEEITFPYYSDVNNIVKAVNIVDRSAIYTKVMESATLCRNVVSNLVSNCEQ